MRSASAIVAVGLLLAYGCSDDESTTNNEATSSTSSSSVSATSGSASSSGSGGAGGMGTGGMASTGAGYGGGDDYMPTASDIQFQALAAMPTGEQILFNDWSVPDVVRSMQPNGSGVVDLFSAYRVWSMGVSNDGTKLAFASGDPMQQQHFGITIGDAIQHTFLYDIAAQSASLLTWGRINDECHHFAPSDAELYLCRRYDFDLAAQSKGYQVGRVTLGSGAFEFVTDAEDGVMTLNPVISPDGSTLLYTKIELTTPSGIRSIWQIDLPNGTPKLLRTSAHRPLFFPNGQRYLYADTSNNGSLYSSSLAGGDEVLVASASGTSAAFSPDGGQIAFLNSPGAGCAHIDVVASDGSEAGAPTRLRDCSVTGEFITELAWIVRP
jgi:hypothetical protein